ncbi:MAG: tRNA 4-thiouridine(8) synthase ThiI [Clostridia bacterium]|nr:tRNA 4-thiouridine(8) synthase ThiI [Clostridia bacterium]
MRKVILLRYGEIHLKGRNRSFFEKLLIDNINNSLKDIKCKVKRISGRYLITDFEDKDYNKITDKVRKIFGLTSLSCAWEIETNQAEIEKQSLLFFDHIIKTIKSDEFTFKVSVKRSDKNFPFHSDKFSAHLGGIVLEKYKKLKVNLSKPEIEFTVEIRDNGFTYILMEKINCVGGMPVGSAGQGLLMLSGGIDSPVAGYLMAKRGLTLNAVHFFSFPYTSMQAKDKVIKLAQLLSDYAGNIRIFMVPFTKIQEQIHTKCDDKYMITIMRRFMFKIAENICEKYNINAIITGENLGQVASQTIESITVFNSILSNVPVLRPVISFDKSEIIQIAKNINTYETSILPYEDCCTIFLPQNPIIKPNIEKVKKQESKLEFNALIENAMENIDIIHTK